MKPEALRRALCLVLLTAVTLPAMAQWTGKGEAGLAIASGNSDSKSANARIAIGRKLDAWEHTLSLAGLYVRNQGATSARRWEVGAQSRLTFIDRNFWYGGLRYEEDRFSGFDHQGSVTTGVGRKFIDRENTRLSAQVGAGYKFSQTVDTLTDLPVKNSNVAGVANVDFEHRLNENTKVFDRFAAEVVSGNKFLQNDIGVAVKVSDRMALNLAYGVRHNTAPPAGFRKTDTLSTVNLVYEVK